MAIERQRLSLFLRDGTLDLTPLPIRHDGDIASRCHVVLTAHDDGIIVKMFRSEPYPWIQDIIARHFSFLTSDDVEEEAHDTAVDVSAMQFLSLLPTASLTPVEQNVDQYCVQVSDDRLTFPPLDWLAYHRNVASMRDERISRLVQQLDISRQQQMSSSVPGDPDGIGQSMMPMDPFTSCN